MKRLIGIVMTLALLMLSACSSQPAKEISLEDVMNGLSGKYSLEEGMLRLTADDLLDLYGIQTADVKQFEARMKLESIQADEIVLIEAADSAAAKRVKEMLDARYQTKLNEARDYLPDEYAKIEKCSVKQNGNFVSMIVHADAEAIMKEYEDSLK